MDEAQDDLQQDDVRPANFDAEGTAKLLGLSDQQFKFCLARMRGANQTQAAEAAGYKGTYEQIKSAGSRVARSRKVMRFIELARLEGGSPVDQPADYDELERVLSRALRGSDTNSAIRAGEALHRIREARRVPDQDEPLEPAAAIEIIAGYSPDLAADLAAADGLPFTLSDDHRQRAAERHRAIAEHWIRDNPQRALQIASFFARGGGTHGAAA